MKVLAIESTCDETGVAVVEKQGLGVKVIVDIKASSAEIQEKYGGIVPEVAAREQVKVIIPVVQEAMRQAGVNKDDIDAVAVSFGPGLMGSLLIGVESAKALALAWGKPLIPVNHMRGHVLANWIGDRVPELPAVALVVSGGHTELIYMKSLDEWEALGGTRDDAAGECFDKCARTLGLPYPGGPSIEKASAKAAGKKLEIRLPRPMLNQDNLEMSFSGIKTALVNSADEQTDLWAREVNEAIVEVLTKKTVKAVKKYQPKSLLLAGGVAANKLLREKLESESSNLGVTFWVPEFKYCTDNAAMIGVAAVLGGDRLTGRDILNLRPEPSLEVVI